MMAELSFWCLQRPGDELSTIDQDSHHHAHTTQPQAPPTRLSSPSPEAQLITAAAIIMIHVVIVALVVETSASACHDCHRCHCCLFCHYSQRRKHPPHHQNSGATCNRGYVRFLQPHMCVCVCARARDVYVCMGVCVYVCLYVPVCPVCLCLCVSVCAWGMCLCDACVRVCM